MSQQTPIRVPRRFRVAASQLQPRSIRTALADHQQRFERLEKRHA